MKDQVMVIGGSGFLGSHIADSLSESGYKVKIYDLQASPWLRPDQEMIVGDIRNEKLLYECLKDTRYVYHLAGISDIGMAANYPKDTIEHNIIGSTIVLDASIKAKVERIMFASTVYVYSNQGSFYRVSKQAIELIIEAYHERYGIDYTILRYGSLYGPRAQEWNGLRRYVFQAIREGRIIYQGTGEEKREFIHVKDAAHLSVNALAQEYANECLILTGTQVLSSKDFLQMIQEILGGKPEVEYRPKERDPIHYSITPYRFSPRVARKMVPNVFIDIGQGILDLVEEIYREINSEK